MHILKSHLSKLLHTGIMWRDESNYEVNMCNIVTSKFIWNEIHNVYFVTKTSELNIIFVWK